MYWRTLVGESGAVASAMIESVPPLRRFQPDPTVTFHGLSVIVTNPAGSFGHAPDPLALLTVTTTGAEVIEFPAASRATAVIVCDPFPTCVVFHVIEYGDVMS